MAFKFPLRTRDTASSITGTTITLNGTPPTGFRSFDSGVGDGNTCYYMLLDSSGNFESGYGTYTHSSTSLARAATPVDSSNGGAQVAAFSGTVYVLAELESSFLNALVSPESAVPSSRYYTNLLAGTTQQTAIALTAGTVYYAPVVIGQPFSSVVLGFSVGTLISGTSTAIVGLYTVTQANGGPASKLVDNNSAPINCGTGGSTGANYTGTLTLGKPEPPGLYALGFLSLTNGAKPTTYSTGYNGNASVVGVAAAGGAGGMLGWTDTVTGQSSLPATASPTTYSSNIPAFGVGASL